MRTSFKKSIVLRTAVVAALLSGALSILILGMVFEAQEGIYEQRLADEVRLSLVGMIERTDFSPSDPHTMKTHLVDLRDRVQTRAHVVYAYIVNDLDGVLVGLDAAALLHARAGKFFVYPWEPNVLTGESTTMGFTATRQLASVLPQRVQLYQRMMLVTIALPCQVTTGCPFLRVALSTAALNESLERLRVSLLFSAIFIPLSTGLAVFFTTRRFLMPFREISERMRALASRATDQQQSGADAGNEWAPAALSVPENDLQETRYLRESLQQFTLAMNQASVLKNDLATNRSLADLARQVAHDIRSPLAALEAVVGQLDGLPADKRKIFQSALARIRDIANGLLRHKSTIASAGVEAPARQFVDPYILRSILSRMMSEKRLQYGGRLKLTLEEEYDASSYAHFSNISDVELSRVLSNLIDNAVEAIDDQGVVHLRLEASPNREGALITINDNGRGIPEHVLPKIFSQGFTFGKSHGSGLGLYHARTMIESWGGTIAVDSRVQRGTTTKIELPLVEPATWFPVEMVIAQGAALVICDDDQPIHDLWQHRLQDNDLARLAQLEVSNFKDSESCLAWFRMTPEHQRPTVFLVDYDIRGSELNGLELIKALGVGDRAWLVTSHSDEVDLQQASRETGIRILPKELVSNVPIRCITLPAAIDAVLIDDDPWVRDLWTLSMQKAGRSIFTCASSAEFFVLGASINKDTPIFIDFYLGRERGDTLGTQLATWGYTNLHCASGLTADDLPPMPWARSVIEKEIPDWLLDAKT